jgi:hypothetical protein
MVRTATSKDQAEAPSAATDKPGGGDLAALLTPQRYEAGDNRTPAEVVTFVESAYEAWEKDKSAWLCVTLSGAEAVEKVHKQARRYCYERATRLTFQRRRTDDPRELVYRVRSKISQRRATK